MDNRTGEIVEFPKEPTDEEKKHLVLLTEEEARILRRRSKADRLRWLQRKCR